jgi:hypothetical protein
MTPQDLLTTCRQAGIVLAVDGDALDVNAPKGTLTPELRDELARQKPALLALLAPATVFVPLKGGLTLPLDVIKLALDLEAREIPLHIDADHQFIAPADPRLTPLDQAGIARWHRHLAALIEYYRNHGWKVM